MAAFSSNPPAQRWRLPVGLQAAAATTRRAGRARRGGVRCGSLLRCGRPGLAWVPNAISPNALCRSPHTQCASSFDRKQKRPAQLTKTPRVGVSHGRSLLIATASATAGSRQWRPVEQHTPAYLGRTTGITGALGPMRASSALASAWGGPRRGPSALCGTHRGRLVSQPQHTGAGNAPRSPQAKTPRPTDKNAPPS
jgi:hypothetical protein